MKVSVKCKVCGNAKELIINKNHINKAFKCKCGAKGFYSKNNDHRSNVEVNIILINKINTIKTTSVNPKRVTQVSQNINFNKPKITPCKINEIKLSGLINDQRQEISGMDWFDWS